MTTRKYLKDREELTGQAWLDAITALIERVENRTLQIGDFTRVAYFLQPNEPSRPAAILIGSCLKRQRSRVAMIGVAVKLIERVLPEWEWQVEKNGSASLWLSADVWAPQTSHAKTPSEALIAAALKVRRASWKM